jgi:RNA polymerase sigma-70 factor, ECF subfamily
MDSLARCRMQNRHDYVELPDNCLVELCQEGDHAAFAELMRRHERPALNIAVSILRDREEAKDETQNAFWKAYRHIKQFQQDARFSTWLTRIVVNQCLMRLRQVRRTRFTYVGEPHGAVDLMMHDLSDSRHTPEERLLESEITKVLAREIRCTPPLLRHVFLLRDVQQRPMAEVAETLGISVTAAKSRLLRARAELRSRMRRHCSTLPGSSLTGWLDGHSIKLKFD